MKMKIYILCGLCLVMTVSGFAVKTSRVEIGVNANYDGKVKIYRDEQGNMVFVDDQITSPVTLSSLDKGIEEHSKLTGLGEDDHAQYLNATRHQEQHSADFNDSLPVSPDVNGHTLLGQHLQDSNIHISRTGEEIILGPWKYDVPPEFRANVKFSLYGEAGKADLYFKDEGEEDAHIRWDQGNDRFQFNRKIQSDEAEHNILRVLEGLYGNEIKGPYTGKIANFDTIEGIKGYNLVDRSADEDIYGDWDFLSDVYVDGDFCTSGVINPMGGIKGLGKANVLTVSSKGGDYKQISNAVSAADSGDVIIIYPGTYTESTGVQITKPNVSIIGTDRDLCIIERPCAVETIGYNSGTVNLRSAGCSLMNLTIKNTEQNDGSKATAAIVCSSGAGSITNCYIGGNGGRDTLSILNTADILCQNVTVEQYRESSSGSHMIWVANNASLNFQHGRVLCGNGGGPQLNTTGDVKFSYVFVEATGYALDSANCDELSVLYCTTSSSNWFNTSSYSTLNSEFTNGIDMEIENKMTFEDDVEIYGYTGGSAVIGCLWDYAHIDHAEGRWMFSDDGSTWNVDLYKPFQSEKLKTNDTFDVKSLEIYGSETIDTSRNISANNITLSDDKYMGMGSAKGRIEFDDQSTDKIMFKDSELYLGSGTVENKFLNSNKELNVEKVTVDSLVLNNNEIDGGGTLKVTDNLDVTGGIKVQGMTEAGYADTVTYNPSTGELGHTAGGACPVVFYRIDGGKWQCAGEIIKNANGNIFQGIVKLGKVHNSITIQVVNLKDEVDFIDYVAILEETQEDANTVRMEEFPVEDEVTGEPDGAYRRLEKGDGLEYTFEINGVARLKLVGFYERPLTEIEKEKRNCFLEGLKRVHKN